MMKILKIIGIMLVGLLVLILAAITVAVNYLKPERLTPLVERETEKYLNADVSLGRVEISFYSTFPRFVLDVSRLQVNTKAFATLPADVKASLPAYADSLLWLEGLNASVNIPKLLGGTIELYDIVLTNPRVNIVQATTEVGSLDIFPASEEEKEEKKSGIPDFSFSTFRVDSTLYARYTSLPDTIDGTVRMHALALDGQSAPLYSIDINGSTALTLPSFSLPLTRVGLDGGVEWSPSAPLELGLQQLNVRVGDVAATIDSRLSLDDPLTFHTFQLTLPQTPFRAIRDLVPEGLRGELDKLDAKFDIGLKAELTRPFNLVADTIPSCNLVVEIPEGGATYDGMTLDKFALLASAEVDGSDLDRSKLTIDRLFAQGEGMGFALEGSVTQPLSDPKVEGIFKGGLNFSLLPKSLLNQVPGKVAGVLKADCTFSLRRSWLTPDGFHRIKLKGEASLTDLNVDIPAFPLDVYARKLDMRLGTSSSFTRGEHTVDSLLTLSLKADTLACDIDSMLLRTSDLALGIGCKNTGSSSDTTLVNPIGGRITLGRLSLRSPVDSMTVYLRKASAGISLRRFKGQSRRPQLSLTVSADRAFYADAVNRAMLTEAFTGVTVYPSTSAFNQRRLARLDSLRRAHPTLSRDSLMALNSRLMSERRAAHRTARPDTVAADGNQLDLEVDGSIRRLLRRWAARGRLRAARVAAYTPMFPLRSRITNLSMRFNSDSVNIEDTRIRVGHSDFVLDGTISNITRALTSRNGSQPLHLDFEMRSDTINVNEIAAAVFAGAAWAEKNQGGELSVSLPPDDITEEAVMETATPTDSSMAVLVIPTNVTATLRLNAANIIYSDLVFRDFRGVLNAYEGALNLSELSARSDVGSLNLNALYSASSVKEASFAFGLRIKDFHIREFLDLVPAIDSLMPLLDGISGIINADLAATTDVDSAMNIDIPSLKAALKISGDSLVVVDKETFRSVGKWLLFKHKERNMIDSMTVEMIVDNSQLQMFPFVFNLDRYKLGVSGSNDMAMNFDYHVAVLKSPLPFKFGINISGNPDKMKIRLGKAKFNEKNLARTVAIADTTRINLVREIGDVFRRGVKKGGLRRLDFNRVSREIVSTSADAGDTISHADSLYFINQGVLPAPPQPDTTVVEKKKSRKLFRR
ncbi:MAG: AsmA family protein [Muribaculaceae bacterium]|nr:AsmA family protein [Muribaculaceae bacterium]